MLHRYSRVILPLLGLVAGARADEAGIRDGLKAFFQAEAGPQRAAIVARIEGDPAYDRARVASWLAQLEVFEPLEAGMHTLTVPIDGGRAERSVALRAPQGYDPRQLWPLIYAFHGTGGDGPSIIRYLEQVLGDEIEQFVVAAPSAYENDALQSPPPASTQHLDVLRAVKLRCRIDSGRVYLTGYSRGGHAAWTLGALHAEQFAGVMPLAGSLMLPEIDKLWPDLLPNLAATPVLAVWGRGDALADGAAFSPEGGIAGLNRRMCKLTESLRLPVTCVELEDAGHGDVVPPLPELRRMLRQRRSSAPGQVRHVFRHEYQASAYWLEGRDWTGPAWGGEQLTIELAAGDDPHEAMARALRNRLGRVEGERKGQVFLLKRKSVKEVVVWIEEGMVDWDKPVTVKMSNRVAFDGLLRPSLAICLSEAARTYDFDRLRWAGVRVRSGKGEAVAP